MKLLEAIATLPPAILIPSILIGVAALLIIANQIMDRGKEWS